jgi:DNA-binding NarL/FixJ family response regulator
VSTSPVPVLIASRFPAYAAGLAGFLSNPPLRPLIAHTVGESLAVCQQTPPALALIDWQVADAPGMELATELVRRSPGTRILFVVDDASNQLEIEAMAAGASGVVLRTWTQAAVLDAVADALRGFSRFDVDAVRSLSDLVQQTSPRQVLLTEQERVVLRLMRQQLTYKEIAMRLGVSWHTVRTHAQSILRKLGIHSRRDLDGWDARLGSPAEQLVATATR